MSRIVALIGRLLVMLVGYGIAAMAASAFLHFVAWPAVGREFEQEAWESMGGLLFSVPLIGLFIASVAFLPSLVLLAAAEFFLLRSWLYYAVAGAGAAFTAFAIVWSGLGSRSINLDGSAERPLIAEPTLVLHGIAAGMVGALAYWIVAGRNAGRWRNDSSFSAPD